MVLRGLGLAVLTAGTSAATNLNGAGGVVIPTGSPGDDSVPEPATLAVFGAMMGFGAIGYRLRRKPAVAA